MANRESQAEIFEELERIKKSYPCSKKMSERLVNLFSTEKEAFLVYAKKVAETYIVNSDIPDISKWEIRGLQEPKFDFKESEMRIYLELKYESSSSQEVVNYSLKQNFSEALAKMFREERVNFINLVLEFGDDQTTPKDLEISGMKWVVSIEDPCVDLKDMTISTVCRVEYCIVIPPLEYDYI